MAGLLRGPRFRQQYPNAGNVVAPFVVETQQSGAYPLPGSDLPFDYQEARIFLDRNVAPPHYEPSNLAPQMVYRSARTIRREGQIYRAYGPSITNASPYDRLNFGAMTDQDQYGSY